MKRRWVTAALALLMLATLASSGVAGGINDPHGVPLYVIIEVEWDGTSTHGDWTVWGPAWDPVLHGTLLTSCTDCLEMNYEFTCRGKTLLFRETMVPTVVGTPQVSQVVLTDLDGDGTYTGSLSALHYFPWRPEPDDSWAILYFDRLDYQVEVDENCTVTSFYYVQYEHKKLP